MKKLDSPGFLNYSYILIQTKLILWVLFHVLSDAMVLQNWAHWIFGFNEQLILPHRSSVLTNIADSFSKKRILPHAQCGSFLLDIANFTPIKLILPQQSWFYPNKADSTPI